MGVPEDRKLRIGLVAPPWYEVPPSSYGGVESVVAHLADQLVGAGHDVTLVSAGRAATRARQLTTYDSPPTRLLGEPVPELVQAALTARLLADEAAAGRPVDLVHEHSLAGPLLAWARDVPTVVTMHGPAEEELTRYYAALGDRIALVAISDAQRRRAPGLPWVGTVHNAVDVSSFPYQSDKDDLVVWLGRYAPEKGPDLAVDAAREAGVRIVCAGKRTEPTEVAFFHREIVPRLGRDVVEVGTADHRQKRALLARARCLVFPVSWEEPFGLVMVEAMACGTPVVALRRGSVPEVVVDKVTGFICDHPRELPEAIRDTKLLDPLRCREHVERHFDLPMMRDRYERVYRTVLDTSPPGRAG